MSPQRLFGTVSKCHFLARSWRRAPRGRRPRRPGRLRSRSAARSRRRRGRRCSRGPCRCLRRSAASPAASTRPPCRFPGRARRRLSAVAPKTRPSATTTPFGPWSASSYFFVHSTSPRLEVDRLHVGLEVLRVDDAVDDDRRGGVGAVGALRGQRQGPGFFQVGDVGAVDRALRLAAVGGVDAGVARAGRTSSSSPEDEEHRTPTTPRPAATASSRPADQSGLRNFLQTHVNSPRFDWNTSYLLKR